MNSDKVSSEPDRRVRRTRQLLQEALVELVQEKPYDKITVQEILERANVGRSTFYAHFHDKEDLLTGNFAQTVAEEIVASQPRVNAASINSTSINSTVETDQGEDEPDSVVAPMLSLLRHARENYHLYEALKGSEGIRSILDELRTTLQPIISERVQEMRPDFDCQQQRLTLHFLCEGLMAAMLYWLEDEPTMPAEEVDAQLQDIMLNGLGGKR